jgi:uncharacterized membrane protein
VKAEHGTGFKQACRWGAVLILGIGYSVLAHLAAASTTPDSLDALVAIIPLVGLAFVMAWRSSQRTVMLALCLAACAGLYGMSTWLVTHYNWVFLLQHAGVYALLCVAFGRTLQAGRTPMVTGFARLVHRTLSPALIGYTRSVTWAWTLYFGSISGLSLVLFWLAPIAIWSAFANLLGIPLLVLMFVGEYAVRCYVLPVADRAGPLEAIRAYRQASSSGTARQP